MIDVEIDDMGMAPNQRMLRCSFMVLVQETKKGEKGTILNNYTWKEVDCSRPITMSDFVDEKSLEPFILGVKREAHKYLIDGILTETDEETGEEKTYPIVAVAKNEWIHDVVNEFWKKKSIYDGLSNKFKNTFPEFNPDPREREVLPMTPPPEKEKLVGAASLESDVLLDNIQRAKERIAIAGGKEPNTIAMNRTTYEILANVDKAQPMFLYHEVRLVNEMKSGEFVLMHVEEVV